MTFRNFTIDIRINKLLLEVESGEFSFSIRDSIYDFYPKLSFSINDTTGLFSEYLLFNPGIEIEITYGLNDEVLKNKFVINNNELTDQESPGFINGNISLKAIHSYFNKQEKISSSYSGTPSSIIPSLISNYPFYKINIESSLNKRTWYRPFITQREMIEDIFLENVNSNDSNSTPFFTFIDSNDEFYFQSFYTLMKKNPIVELNLSPNNNETFSPNTILSFMPFFESYSNINNNLTKKFYSYNKSDFSLNEEILNITSIFPGSFPIVKEEVLTSDFKYLGYKYDTSLINDQIGQKLFSFRKSLLAQKAVITIPLNTKLTAGKTINLAISASTEDKNSISYSGKYLIERSDHVWNKETQTGYSILVVGRKVNELPSNYLLKEKFYKP